MRPSRRRANGRVLDRLPGLLVDDAKHFFQRAADGFGLAPAGKVFGHFVHERDACAIISGDHGVANAGQRGPQPFALLIDGVGRLRKRIQVPPQQPDERGHGRQA